MSDLTAAAELKERLDEIREAVEELHRLGQGTPTTERLARWFELMTQHGESIIALARRALAGGDHPASGIFDHKWLDPACVAEGCKSLFLKHAEERADSLAARVAELEGRLREIDAAWKRVAGFAVCESCGPHNRYRVIIDYQSLEQAQDAYTAMHEISAALSSEKEGGA